MSCADHLKLKVGLHKNMVLKVGLKLKHRLGLLEKYEAFVWLISVLLNSDHGTAMTEWLGGYFHHPPQAICEGRLAMTAP